MIEDEERALGLSGLALKHGIRNSTDFHVFLLLYFPKLSEPFNTTLLCLSPKLLKS